MPAIGVRRAKASIFAGCLAGLNREPLSRIGRLRIGYGIDPDKIISPGSNGPSFSRRVIYPEKLLGDRDERDAVRVEQFHELGKVSARSRSRPQAEDLPQTANRRTCNAASSSRFLVPRRRRGHLAHERSWRRRFL